MIAGIGIDIVEVERIRNVLAGKSADRFLERTFTEKEICYCRKFKDPYPRFAARFAVKEAFIKSASSFVSGIPLNRIETVNSKSGAPSINVDPSFYSPKGHSVHVSITHTETVACAVVVLEKA